MATLLHGDHPSNYADIERLRHSSREGCDGRGLPCTTLPPQSISLTPYHFLNFSVIFAFGCWKAVASYRGQATLSTTLDMLGGTILPLLYVERWDTLPCQANHTILQQHVDDRPVWQQVPFLPQVVL